MKSAEALQIEQLTRRLKEAEATIAALLTGQIDAVFDPRGVARDPILLADAQRALREERDRAQRYLDTPDVLLLSLNPQGQVTLVNRYACAVLGHPKTELIGTDWIGTAIPARHRHDARRDLEKLMAGYLPIVEYPVLTRSGEERLIEWRNTLLRDEQGGIVGTLSAGTDITERRLAEAELQRATTHLIERTRTLEQQTAELSDQAALLDLAESAIFVLDMDGRIQFWSRGAEKMYGWTSEETIGRLKRELLQLDLSQPREQVDATLLSEGRWSGEATHRSRDGTLVTVARRSNLQLSADGRPRRVLTIDNDITKRKAAESERNRLADELSSHVDALRVSEERMNYALQAARTGVWDLDIATQRLTWSETLAPLFGLTPEQAPSTAKDFVALIHPDDRRIVRDSIALAQLNGSSFDQEFRVVWPDGSVHWQVSRGRAVADEGTLTGIGMDISDRKSLEVQFRQAQKMEAIGLLAGGVAHDFNNLLSVMLGYADFVTQTFDPQDDRRSDMAEIIQAGTRAAALTRQLLAFSRQQVLHPTNLDLSSLVTGMLPMFTRVIGEHLELRTTLHSEIVIRADPGQIEQVLMNLVVNARDAMPSGGVLAISTEVVQIDGLFAGPEDIPSGEYALLRVSDTGSGMTEATRAQLFQPFFTTKGRGEGTGLGLATAYGIIQQSGGYVTASSELGVGSTFRVYLPSIKGGVDVIPDDTNPEASLRGDETILVVEDEEAVRLLAGRMLENAGYTVLKAANPKEAEALFLEYSASIDLLLTDVIMPGSSGPELFQSLLLQRPDLRVLYMSGYTDDAILHHGQLDPSDDFLQKPFTAKVLCGRVRGAIGMGSSL